MAQHAREPLWLEKDLELPDDPLLEAAFAISEWAMMILGPIFWISLGYLFLVAELGR